MSSQGLMSPPIYTSMVFERNLKKTHTHTPKCLYESVRTDDFQQKGSELKYQAYNEFSMNM